MLTIGPQNGLYKPSSAYGSGTPILRIDGFYDGMVTDISTLKRVQISGDEQARYGLREGEIVINRVNSREYLGKSAIVPSLREPTVFESNMMRLDVDRTLIHPVFLIEYLQAAVVRRHIIGAAKDAINQSSINQQDVKAIPILLPPLAVQNQFVRRRAAALEWAEAQRRALTTLDVLFASLQHRAFRGEL